MALAWLTPDVADFAGSPVERIISLPGDLFFYVTGALSMLSEENNWEELGDATPQETAEFFQEMLEDYLMSSFRNVGMIAAFSSALFPPGWIGMNGQTLAQSDYPELTAVVPDTWKSGSNLIIPSTRGGFLRDTPVGGSQGASGGSNTHTLTVNEIPAHTHTTPSVPTPAVAATPGPLQVIAALSNGPTASTGNGQPHNNMPQFVQVRFAVYAGR